MRTKRILVVDDEVKVRNVLRECFENDGYEVIEADGEDALESALKTTRFDLITLDIRLDGANGLDLIDRIRAQRDVPVIMITGQHDVIDRVVGLEKGADDYITKPFHLREVLARTRAVIRRAARSDRKKGHRASPKNLQFSGWTLYPDRHALIGPDGEPCELTAAEFKLLHVLARNPGRILSRDRLMDLLKGSDWSPLDRTIDNQIARLRRKLEADPRRPRLIKTVRGAGYTLAADIKPGSQRPRE